MAFSPHPLLRALICPDDAAAVAPAGPDAIACTHCGRLFPLEGNLVSMLPAASEWDEEVTADVAAERAQRDHEAARYDHLLGLRLLSHWEIPATLRPLEITSADRVLEVGCGTGRFTRRIVDEGRELIAVDHSSASLRILKGKLSGSQRESVLLVQGDATRLPIRGDWATRSLSCQVLEHLPGDEVRRRAVSELARTLERSGRLALSAYWHTPGLGWLLAREGKHSGAIYFHRFQKPELLALLGEEFDVEALSGRLVYVLLAHLRRR